MEATPGVGGLSVSERSVCKGKISVESEAHPLKREWILGLDFQQVMSGDNSPTGNKRISRTGVKKA